MGEEKKKANDKKKKERRLPKNSSHLALNSRLSSLSLLSPCLPCRGWRVRRRMGAGSAIYLHHCRGQRSARLVRQKNGASPKG